MEVVFSVGPTDYVWGDVLDWAVHQAEWDDHVRETREGTAALRLAHELGTPLDEGEVRAAASAFRRRRRLISAEDTERWLAERRLSVAAWMDHVRRSMARERHVDELAGMELESTVADEEARLWATGVCSGAYQAFAAALAERVAVAEARAEPGPAGGSGRDRWDALEHAYRDFKAEAATDRAVAEEIQARRLDWIGVDLEWVSFADEAAAREALLCFEEDGDFSASASAGPGPARRHAQLCDVEPELRPALLGAREGDAIGPIRVGDDWRVTRLVSKDMPMAADGEVRRRAVEAVAARAVRREVQQRVRWHERY